MIAIDNNDEPAVLGGDQTRRPGMLEVAERAGVSAQTVSRTLRNHPNVHPDTRAKVLAAVEELGYRRNRAAGALSSGRTQTIGVVLHHSAAYSEGSLTLGVERAARAAGYAVTVATASSVAPEAVEEAVGRVVEQGVDGIVLAIPQGETTARLEELTRAVPTVATDGSRTPWAEVVSINQREIGERATQHLLDLGHETVWHVTGAAGWIDSVQREQGWRAALTAAGREVPPELTGDWTAASGYRAGLVLGRIPEVTAVFAACDDIAFGVLRALRELGRDVPADISVIGVDDIPLAAYSAPPLTTVAQPFQDIGAVAFTHLMQLIDQQHAAEIVEIDPQIVVRASTAEPPTSRTNASRTIQRRR